MNKMIHIWQCLKIQSSGKYLVETITNIFAFIGVLMSILQGIDFFFPDVEFATNIILLSKNNILFIFLGTTIFVVAYRCRNLGIKWKCKGLDLEIEIRCCDIFSQEGAKVVQFSNTFETDITEGRLVKAGSVNAQFIEKHYKGNRHDLDCAITSKLKELNIRPKFEDSQLYGKKTTYNIGTVCPLKIANDTYFLTAFGKMRHKGNVTIRTYEYSNFLAYLWTNISRVASNDETINVTVFGESHTTGLPAEFNMQDKIHEIIRSFILSSREKRFCRKLRICLLPKDIKKFDYEDCKLVTAYFDKHSPRKDFHSNNPRRGNPMPIKDGKK